MSETNTSPSTIHETPRVEMQSLLERQRSAYLKEGEVATATRVTAWTAPSMS